MGSPVGQARKLEWQLDGGAMTQAEIDRLLAKLIAYPLFKTKASAK